MKQKRPEIRLHYKRVRDEKSVSRPHGRKKRRPVPYKKDHRIHPKKEKAGLATLWPGEAGPGLRLAFKAADALGIDGQNSKLVKRGIALGQVVTALLGSSSKTDSRGGGKTKVSSSYRIYEKRPARSSENRRAPPSGEISEAKWEVIDRGDAIFPKYQTVELDWQNNEYMEYPVTDHMRTKYGLETKYIKSTVFRYLDSDEQRLLEKKVDKIDNTIKKMGDSAFKKSKAEWILKYANIAAIAIQLAVEALLQDCPGHFLGSKGKQILKNPDKWSCDYDKDARGRRKRPLQAIEDLMYRMTTDKNSVFGGLAQYQWFFNRKDNKDHQLRYVQSDWNWYLHLSKDLRDMLSSSGPIYEDLSFVSNKYQLTSTEQKLFDKTVKRIWQTWTWARYLVCEHWRYVEIDEKSGAVYDERIEMLGDLSVLSDRAYKRAKRKYRDKQEDRAYKTSSRTQSVASRSRSQSRSKGRSKSTSKR